MTTFTVDLWDKYWPPEIKDRTNLDVKLRESMGLKGLTVQSIDFIDIPAQADALGQRTVVTIRASAVDSSLDHDYFARYLGLNP